MVKPLLDDIITGNPYSKDSFMHDIYEKYKSIHDFIMKILNFFKIIYDNPLLIICDIILIYIVI